MELPGMLVMSRSNGSVKRLNILPNIVFVLSAVVARGPWQAEFIPFLPGEVNAF